MADVYEQDLHRESTERVKPSTKPKFAVAKSLQPRDPVYLPQFVEKTNWIRNYFYENNDIPDSQYDTYQPLPVRDSKALGKIYNMIVQEGGVKSRQKLEGSGGGTGIASGNPCAQTRMVIGNPIGWRMGGNFVDGLTKAKKVNEGQWPSEDRVYGSESTPTNRLGARKWTKDNFATWERYNCWICGLPLHWDSAKPEGEHKLPYGFMCAFGPGPVTKLCLVKDDDNDIKELDNQSNRRSIYSSVSATLAARFEPEFKDWKDTCRGEEYAWSHPYCNKKKHSINFVKIGVAQNNDIVYYINYSAIKFVANLIQDRKPVRSGSKYVLQGKLTKAKGGSEKSFDSGVLNELVRQCNVQGTRAQRYQNWGAKFMYENMVNQLKPLVYLLNEGFPDMGHPYYLDNPQEKIRTNIYFNYKRLCKNFPQMARRNQVNKGLHDFFNNIFDDSDEEESRKFLDDLFDNRNTMASYAAAGGGKIQDGELKKANVTQDDVDTFLRQFTDIKLHEIIFANENETIDLFEDPFNPQSQVYIDELELDRMMGNPVIEVIDDGDKKVAAVAVVTEHEEPDYGPKIKQKYTLNEVDISFMGEDEEQSKSRFLKKLREDIIEDQKLNSDLKMGVHNMVWLEYYKKLAQFYLDYFQDFFSKNTTADWYKACCEGEGKEKLIDQIYYFLYPQGRERRRKIKSLQTFRILYNKFREFEIGEFENAIKADRDQKDEFYLYDEEKAFLRTRKDEINQMFADGNDIHYILGSLKRKYSIGLKSPHPQSLPPSGKAEQGKFIVSLKRKNDLDKKSGYAYFKKFIEDRDYEKSIEVRLKEEFERKDFTKSIPTQLTAFLEKTEKGMDLIQTKEDLQKKIKKKPVPMIFESRKDPLGAFAGIASKAAAHYDEEQLLAEAEIAEKGGSDDVEMSGDDGGKLPAGVGSVNLTPLELAKPVPPPPPPGYGMPLERMESDQQSMEDIRFIKMRNELIDVEKNPQSTQEEKEVARLKLKIIDNKLKFVRGPTERMDDGKEPGIFKVRSKMGGKKKKRKKSTKKRRRKKKKTRKSKRKKKRTKKKKRRRKKRTRRRR